VAGYCEHGNEPSDTIKGGNFWIRRVAISFSRSTLLSGVSGVSSLVSGGSILV